MTTAYAQSRRRARGGLAPVSVGDAMHRGVIDCPPAASLVTVAAVMAAHRIHAVVVRDDEQGEWGIVSDLDLVGAVGTGELAKHTAGEIAAGPVVTVAPSETVERAAQLMREYGTAHVLVVEPSTRRPAGILSTLDVADVVADTARPPTAKAR